MKLVQTLGRKNIKSRIKLYESVSSSTGTTTSNTTYRFNTIVRNEGKDLTLTQSAANGDSITVNTEGYYVVNATGSNTTGGNIVITLDGNPIQTATQNISNSIALGYEADANGYVPLAASLWIRGGQVIRLQNHASNVGNNTLGAFLSVERFL